MLEINLTNHKLYKISHGAQKFFPKNKVDEWEKKKMVVVYGETNPLGRSPLSQGEIFKNELKIGDYFYLCYGNVNFIAFGQITTKAFPLLLKEKQLQDWTGYYYRKYKIIKVPITNKSYEGEKHWWTPNGDSTICEIYQDDLDKANNLIFNKYFNIHIENSIIENKISRICWNTNYWQFPSGKYGKSKDPNSYEFKNGFGHEEWIGNKFRCINGFCYSNLQTISKFHNSYIGKIFNISLYSRDSNANINYLVGRIKNVEVIDFKESEFAYNFFCTKGWINEMINEVKDALGNFKMLANTESKDYFNIKFNVNDLEIYDEPIKINNAKQFLRNNYFYHLLDHVVEPNLNKSINHEFEFKKGHNKSKTETIYTYTENQKKVKLIHNEVKENIYFQLNKKYGDVVGTENNTGYGTCVDIVRKENGKLIFYEIKAGHNLKLCIRDALSQLIEYGYYPSEKRAEKLIIVAQHPMEADEQTYLKHLRKTFNIPVWYQYYNPEKEILEEKLF